MRALNTDQTPSETLQIDPYTVFFVCQLLSTQEAVISQKQKFTLIAMIPWKRITTIVCGSSHASKEENLCEVFKADNTQELTTLKKNVEEYLSDEITTSNVDQLGTNQKKVDIRTLSTLFNQARVRMTEIKALEESSYPTYILQSDAVFS